MQMSKGFQKTRILLATELCKVVFDIVNADPTEQEIVTLTTTIKEQLKLCTKHIDYNLSAGGKKEYNSRIKLLQEYIKTEDDEDIYRYWACLAYACADLVFDCKIGCPIYFNKKPFFNLLEALERIQEILCLDIEDLALEGTELYNKLSIS